MADQLMHYAPLALFFITGVVALASSILVVTMRNPVHSALYLLVTFLCVAVLFISQGAEFVGAVQVLVYAGGVMVLFLFAVMLINVRQLPQERMLSHVWKGGAAIAVAIFILLVAVARTGSFHVAVDRPADLQTAAVKAGSAQTEVAGNAEAVGMALYSDYLIPFEVASIFLLVAMIGAIVIGKRELDADEEESVPQYIQDRVAAEKEVKEALGA
jgi:NADH-quinone oxidoreductase subunit J